MAINKKLQIAGKYALFIESYIFPFVAVFSILKHAGFIYHNRINIWTEFILLLEQRFHFRQLVYLLEFNLSLMLIFFNISVIVGLMIRKKAAQEFSDWREITVPMACVFFFILFNLSQYLPRSLHISWAPAFLFPYLIIPGILLMMAGTLVSILGVLNLKSSFSVLVEIRDLVTGGLYSTSRHPIYLGHSIRTIGSCLLNCALVYLVLNLIFIFLLTRRALLEENKMLEYQAGYKDYMNKTPSLLLRVFALDRMKPRYPGRFT
jgi:protein-S-isoprenylcysteine O-methyltransferase Ste14